MFGGCPLAYDQNQQHNSEDPMTHKFSVCQKATPNWREKLGAHPFLRGLPEAKLDAIAACCTLRRLTSGSFLFTECQAADSLFLVTSGQIALEIYVPSRGAVQIESVEADGIVGWSSLLGPHAWHVDARCSKASEVIVINEGAFAAVLEDDTALRAEILGRLLRVVYARLERQRLQLLDVYAHTQNRFLARRASGE